MTRRLCANTISSKVVRSPAQQKDVNMTTELDDLDLLQPVYIPVPESLRDLLASGSTTVEQILQENITFRLFRTANPQLVNFFVVHISQLLSLAFDETADLELSAKAFAILEHSQPVIIAALLADQKFHRVACEVLENEKLQHKSMLLNRIASLTLSSVYVDQKQVIDGCGFIMKLLGFLSEPSILSLFENVCAPDEDVYEIQRWLVKLQFPETVLKLIDKFPSQRDANRMSDEANQLCGLFRVICVCGASPVLGPHFCRYSFITILNLNLRECPDFVEFQRWETFVALYCENTKETMRGLFPNAVEILNDNTLCVTRCGVAAVDLLAVMIKLDKVLHPFMVEMNVASTVLSVLVSNPNHTIFHTSAIDFFAVLFKTDALRVPVMDEIVGVLLETFSEENRALRFTMYKLLKLLVKIAKSDVKLAAELRKYDALGAVYMEMTNYRGSLKHPYGGGVTVLPGTAKAVATVAKPPV